MNPLLHDLLSAPRLRVGSHWISSHSTFEVTDPASQRLLSSVPLGDATTLEAATASAHDAFSKSREEPSHLRASRLLNLAQAIEKEAETFAQLLVWEAGKPVTLAHLEVQRAVTTFRLASEEARRQRGALLDLDATPPGESHFGLTRRFPVGPIAALTPFNFPLNLAAHKIAPALAIGNPIILKPSPRTPLTSLLLARIAERAGIPPGFLNVVTCPNPSVPRWLEDHRIRMVSFTGSAAVGHSIQSHLSAKRCTLELGGNATVLLHEDALLEDAILSIAKSAFSYAGQTCISVQNVLVHRSRYDEVRQRLLEVTRSKIRVGDPADPDVLVGPMIDSDSLQKTLNLIQDALQKGAKALCGGDSTQRYLAPTILENVPWNHPCCAEELFAPVLTLTPYTSFEEALCQINSSRYGLQTGVFTENFSLAWRAFSKLEVGAVLVNQAPSWRVENMPYGGVKDSGLGREGIASAIDEMSEPRSWIWKNRAL